MSSVLHPAIVRGRLKVLAGFRHGLYDALTARRDELFELADAVLRTDGAVKTLVELALAPEHQRGHGALYDGINHGGLDIGRLRRAITDTPLPRAADGRLVLAVDVSPWLRPDANTSPDRCFCHTYDRGKDENRMIPGWPYSFVAALESGPTSWTAILDAVRLLPGADVVAVTAAQLREIVKRLPAAGHWTAGDPEILIVTDAGYDAPRIAFLLADLPIQVLGRLRSDRVFRRPAPPYVYNPKGGHPAKHGGEFVFGNPATWGEPNVSTPSTSPQPGSAVGFGTSARRSRHQPVRRNRHDLARDDRLAPATASAPPSTTSAGSSRPARPTPDPDTTRKAPNPAEKVKRQAQPHGRTAESRGRRPELSCCI